MQSKWLAVWKDGVRIVWHSLTWREFQEIQAQSYLCPMDMYLEVYRKCVLEGPPIEIASYGTVTWLASRELEQNPFSGSYDCIAPILAEKRNKVASSYLFSCTGLIASVLHIPFEVIAGWDANEFFSRLAQAELIVGKQLNPVDPGAKQVSVKPRGTKRLAPPKSPERPAVPPETNQYNWK